MQTQLSRDQMHLEDFTRASVHQAIHGCQQLETQMAQVIQTMATTQSSIDTAETDLDAIAQEQTRLSAEENLNLLCAYRDGPRKEDMAPLNRTLSHAVATLVSTATLIGRQESELFTLQRNFDEDVQLIEKCRSSIAQGWLALHACVTDLKPEALDSATQVLRTIRTELNPIIESNASDVVQLAESSDDIGTAVDQLKEARATIAAAHQRHTSLTENAEATRQHCLFVDDALIKSVLWEEDRPNRVAKEKERLRLEEEARQQEPYRLMHAAAHDGQEPPNLDWALVKGWVKNFDGAEKIGEGTFGEVYRGSFVDPVARKFESVAVKKLKPVQLQGADLAEYDLFP
jgi:hypothetical protein